MKSALAARVLAFGAILARAPAWSSPAGSSEDPPISADRPGFLFAPTVMSRGRLQFEAGLPTLTLERDPGGEVRTWSLPVDVRYGLTGKLELRASLPTWNDQHDDTGSSTVDENGFGDSEIGVKLQLPELSGGPLALQASLLLPTGEDPFTAGAVGGSIYLLYGRDLGGSYAFEAMLGATYTPVEDGADETAGSIGASVAHPIADDWSGYVEGTVLPGLQNTPGQSYAGTGILWTPSRDSQLDLSTDFGLDDDSADVIASLGVSWRI